MAKSLFDGYIICGTARTGSTLLCGLLASTKTAGNPDSFFRRQSITRWAAEWGLPGFDQVTEKEFYTAYLEASIRAGKAATDIFGLRLMRENLEELSEILGEVFTRLPSDRLRFERAFGNILYIHLSRNDKLAQAVSLVKAQQTGLWHIAPDGSEVERLAPAQKPHYDFGRIKQEIENFEGLDLDWTSWFEQQDIKPFHVSYENLADNRVAVLARIFKKLGIEAPKPSEVLPSVAKLADEVSIDWMRRYRLDNEFDRQ